MQHALRQAMTADAQTLQLKLPPSGVPLPPTHMSLGVAGGAPVVEALAVTSVWTVQLLKLLAQEPSYRPLALLGLAAVGTSPVAAFGPPDTARLAAVTTNNDPSKAQQPPPVAGDVGAAAGQAPAPPSDQPAAAAANGLAAVASNAAPAAAAAAAPVVPGLNLGGSGGSGALDAAARGISPAPGINPAPGGGAAVPCLAALLQQQALIQQQALMQQQTAAAEAAGGVLPWK